MNIIRVLQLYKHHYLQNYEKELMPKGEYFCWGYFDSMTVREVKSYEESRLAYTQGNINITDLWYTAGENIEDQTGGYGQQNIGLFRYESELYDENVITDEAFWKEEGDLFLDASILQFREVDKLEEKLGVIEKSVNTASQGGIYLRGITYRILDNAHLILFLKSNSYAEIARTIIKINRELGVIYSYSVCGINKEYLDMNAKDSTPKEFHGYKLIDDPIEEIRLEIIANGKITPQEIQKALGLVRRDYSYVIGQTSIEIYVRSIKMADLVKLINNFEKLRTTCENNIFGTKIYNIATVLASKWDTVNIIGTDHSDKGINPDKKWCAKMIQHLKQYDKMKKYKNEMLYSYYLAMLQILNVVSQYESSAFSKDIFWILFPSLRWTCWQFDTIMKKLDPEWKFLKEDSQKVEQIGAYISSIDHIIHHTVHTSQNLLAVPGYSGTLYDLPSKLLLLYMEFERNMIDILNDTDRKYEFYFDPQINSQPNTKEVVWKQKGKNEEGQQESIISITVSQRHLFMPRSLFVILGHETAHYCGKTPRCRKERGSSFIKVCAYSIAYYLFHHENEKIQLSQHETENAEYKKLQDDFVWEREKDVQVYIVEEVAKYVKQEFFKKDQEIAHSTGRENASKEDHYLFAELLPVVLKACIEVLGFSSGKLDHVLRRISQEMSGEENALDIYTGFCEKILPQIDHNREAIIASQHLKEMLDVFEKTFREIYADLACVVVLDLDPLYYLETFYVSEGISLTSDLIDPFTVNRAAVVIETLTRYDWMFQEKWNKMAEDRKKSDGTNTAQPYVQLFDMILAYLKRFELPEAVEHNDIGTLDLGEWEDGKTEWNYFALDAIWHEEVKYAEQCYKKILERNDQKTKEIGYIRRTMLIPFLAYENRKDFSYKKWFESYDDVIKKYRSYVEDLKGKDIKKLEL